MITTPASRAGGKWSVAYEERLKEAHALVQHERDAANAGMYGITIGKNLMKSKFRDRLLKKVQQTKRVVADSRQNLEELKKFTAAVEWQKHWGSSSICCICHNRAVSDVLFCRFCDNVSHRLCNRSRIKKLKQSGQNSYIPPPAPEGVSLTDRFVCGTCEESQKVDEFYYEKYYDKWRLDRLRDFYQRIIARKVLTIIQQKLFKKQRRSFILVQSAVRRSMARNDYLHWQRSQVRVVVIELHQIPKYVEKNDKFLIVLTAIDPIKHSQIFRIDKKPEAAIEEGFLLPGVTGYMTVCVSICQKREEGANHYSVVSQGLLFLRDVEKVSVRKVYNVTFSKTIMWLPLDIKKDNLAHISLPGSVHVVQGTMATNNVVNTTKITPLMNISSNGWTGFGFGFAGNALGDNSVSDAGDNAGGGVSSNANSSSSLPEITRGSTAPSFSLTSASLFDRAQGNSNSVKVHCSGPSVSSHSNHMEYESEEGKLFYYPQNPISTVCMALSGPPLDVLRRVTADQHTRYANGRPRPRRGEVMQSRRRRWWVVHMDLKLYFFEVYGDSRPRIIADVSQATASINKHDKTQNRKISMLHEDGSVWSLDFQTEKEAGTFLFSMTETKASFLEGRSIYMRQDDVIAGRNRQFGYGHLLSSSVPV